MSTRLLLPQSLRSLNWTSTFLRDNSLGLAVVLLISGLTLQIAAAKAGNKYEGYESMIDREFVTTPYLLIGVGFLIYIIAIFGVFASRKHESVLTWTFSIFLGILFVIEMAICIDELSGSSEKAVTDLHKVWVKKMELYRHLVPDAMYTWDKVQKDFSCCGIYGPDDWTKVLVRIDLPMTCCAREVGKVGTTYCRLTDQLRYNQGCMEPFIRFVDSHAGNLGGVVLFVAIFHLVGLILTCVVARKQFREETGTGHQQI